MSDFLFFEAIEEDGSLVDESEEEIKMVSNNDFIDDTEIDDSVEDHYAFTNVNRNYADAFMSIFLILILIKNRIITVKIRRLQIRMVVVVTIKIVRLT